MSGGGLGDLFYRLAANKAVQTGAEKLARDIFDRASTPATPPAASLDVVAATVATLPNRQEVNAAVAALGREIDQQRRLATTLAAVVIVLQIAILVLLLRR